MRWKSFRPLALAWMVSLIYFLPVAFQGRTCIADDAATFEYPNLAFLRDTLGRGHFEAWNPYSSGGLPTMGSTLGRLFYYPQIFFEIFDPPGSMLWYYFLHQLVALSGAYLYLRSHALSRTACVVGCLSYGFSSVYIFRATHVVFLAILTLSPWILYFAERIVASPGPRAALGLCVTVTTVLVGGGWQLTMIFLTAITVYELVTAARSGRLKERRLWLWVGVSAIISLALGAPTLMSLAQLLRMDVMRSVPFRPELSAADTLSWKGLLLSLYPCALGRLDDIRDTPMNEHNYAIGLALLPLWLLALRPGQKHRWWVHGWLSLTLIEALLAMGRNNPAYAWAQGVIPALNNFRGPVRYLTPFCILAMICTGVGAEQLLALRKSRQPFPWGMQVIALLIVGLTVSVYLSVGRTDWWLGDALLAGTVSCCFALIWIRRSRKAVQALLLIGCMLQAAAVWLFVEQRFFTTPEFYRQELAFIARLRSQLPDPNAKIYYATNPETPAAIGVTGIGGLNPLVPSAYLRYLFVALNGREMSDDEFQFLLFQSFHPRYLVSSPKNRQNPMYAMLCSAFMVTPESYTSEALHHPRFWFSKTYRVVHDAREARALMVRLDFDPERTVLLSDDPGRPNPVWQPGKAVISSFKPSSVTFELNGQSGWLTLSDNDYPGWFAEVDGHPRPILQGNTIFRTVAIDPGERRLVLTYNAPELKHGLVLFGLGALALLVLIVTALRVS